MTAPTPANRRQLGRTLLSAAFALLLNFGMCGAAEFYVKK